MALWADRRWERREECQFDNFKKWFERDRDSRIDIFLEEVRVRDSAFKLVYDTDGLWKWQWAPLRYAASAKEVTDLVEMLKT